MATANYNLGLKQVFSSTLSECAADAEASGFAEPQLLFFNQLLADEFQANFPKSEDALAKLFSGQELPLDANPIAQAYAGHQFGHFNPQLGDGRAMVLGELVNVQGQLFELDLKGSGPTPFARGGDGKAALGPMLREVLISEAMAALNVPTTRSLAVVSTGETVYRNPPQKGAVLARIAASQIRIGSFEFFAARDQYDVVEKLIDFCIDRHFTHLKNEPNKALELLRATISAQATLIAKWMGLGFIHGVMNTDNMLISGETIDYGPCAFMDSYDPKTVFSAIDRNSRYAYMNQPGVAQWNLARFAETLLPVIAKELNNAESEENEEDKHEQAITLATTLIQNFMPEYQDAFRRVMCAKLGLKDNIDLTKIDALIEQWHTILLDQKLDWTLAHLYLSDFAIQQDADDLLGMCTDKQSMQGFLRQWQNYRAKDASSMMMHNPAVIPRNHLVEDALELAEKKGELSAFKSLLTHLQSPYTRPTDARYLHPASVEFTESFSTFCGT